ncbi:MULTISPECIES: hypothetical protein [unclassified Caulobacter]|nr:MULTISPECIES: hypothetical protein [unclassified Caulobacter]AZS23308.1 hypothetical protein CSW63_03515 [Caulobacter sp. FWC26]
MTEISRMTRPKRNQLQTKLLLV